MLLLSSGIPNIEDNLSHVCVKVHRVNLGSNCCYVLLFELACPVSFNKGCFSNATVADQDELKLRNSLKGDGCVKKGKKRVSIGEGGSGRQKRLGEEAQI